jgi:tRNA N6-adenosine threonylcarbamoyltransferase
MSGGSGRVLAIETSCDETAVAVVENGRRIVANVVASQVALHAATGGIVPEVAARAHLRWMIPVLEQARHDARIEDWSTLEAIAVTEGPGLAGSLLVGISMAKTLAWLHGLPLVPVNHLEGHIYAAWLLDRDEPERPEPEFPLVALVVSGGHTFVVEMPDHLTYRLLGQTVDDAAGEAFDKVGRLLGLPYPGGPSIMKAATAATQHDRQFPRAWLGDSFDFSFSGLKTAARRAVEAESTGNGARGAPHADGADAAAHADRAGGAAHADRAGGELPDALVAELAYGFQESVVDVLATKTARAAERSGARTIILGGGVAANSVLRERIASRATALGIPLVVPRAALCTDNAAMIGAAGFFRARAGSRAGADLDARPSLKLAV